MEKKENNDLHHLRPDEFDLFEIFKILKSNIKLIAYIVVFTTFMGITYSLNVQSIYRAHVLMVPATSSSGGDQLASIASRFGGLASLAGINMSSTQSSKTTSIAIIKSRSFTTKFIKERALLPIIFSDNWNLEQKVWKDNQEPNNWDAYLAMNGAVSISEDSMTGLISLIVDWDNPRTAAQVANDLVASVNNHLRQQEIKETTKSIKFLQDELSKTSLVSAQTILFNIVEEQTQKIMLANVRDEYAFKVIDPAIAPQDRISPKRKQIVFFSFLLGSVLGSMFVLVRHFYYED
jgi:uncharacterized protein involved in exopolysaccharide biosynthesis